MSSRVPSCDAHTQEIELNNSLFFSPFPFLFVCLNIYSQYWSQHILVHEYQCSPYRTVPQRRRVGCQAPLLRRKLRRSTTGDRREIHRDPEGVRHARDVHVLDRLVRAAEGQSRVWHQHGSLSVTVKTKYSC